MYTSKNLNEACIDNQDVAQIVAMLPHGSGIDCDWDINQWETTPLELVLENEYHAMDEYGMYYGYFPFQVHFDIRDGKILRIDVDDISDEDLMNCPALDGLEDYLWDTIATYLP